MLFKCLDILANANKIWCFAYSVEYTVQILNVSTNTIHWRIAISRRMFIRPFWSLFLFKWYPDILTIKWQLCEFRVSHWDFGLTAYSVFGFCYHCDRFRSPVGANDIESYRKYIYDLHATDAKIQVNIIQLMSLWMCECVCVRLSEILTLTKTWISPK